MSQLIALVATAVIVDGVRTVIQPGEPLPDFGEHDNVALLNSGAAADPQRDRAAAAVAAKDARAAEAEFEAARERVQAEAASIAQAPQEPQEEPADQPPAGKAAKKR
ncbi:MAG: hypothetical protein QM788_05335 [Roseateles sp.]|uniref:hypothetical protein n=1 Tax=Roseateles sp. TaxID=1971397 RepID=UPI0039ED8629